MKSVAAHSEDCLAIIRDSSALEMPLGDAVGSVLVRDAIAKVSLPPADMAGRDGYAIRSTDSRGAGENNPVFLPVVGEIRAGEDTYSALPPGHAMKVSSGSLLPKNADCVVPLEETDDGRAKVAIHVEVAEGDGVRYEAEDFEGGLPALEAGTRIGSRHVALLAAAGLGTVAVKPPPRVVVMSIGDELIEPGKTGHPGTVYDADSYGLATAIREIGATVFRVPQVPDSKQELRGELLNQIVRADIIITTGGLSLGGHDNVKEVVGQLGNVRFDRVAMTPVRQYGVGTIGEGDTQVPIFCLPGNPVAALLGYELFIRPALRQAVGHKSVHRRTIQATAIRPWSSQEGLEEFVPVKVVGKPSTGYRFEPTGMQGTELLYGLARANALAAIPADKETVAVGDTVTCLILD